MKIARWIGYVVIGVGILRVVEYYCYGDVHNHHAIVWALHALIAGPIVVWLTFWLPKKEKEQRENSPCAF